MNAERLLAHYEKIADAPDAIPRLRRFILDLAVHGKLVEQDPNDDPASELLKRVAAEKARLVKTGEIRKRDDLPEITENEFPFTIPPIWCWYRLGGLGFTQTGTTPPKAKGENYGNYIPFIKPGDIYATHMEYSGEGLSKIGVNNSGRIAPAGSILMVCIGTIGKCQKIDRECSFNQQINSLSPYVETSSEYLLAACQSDFFQESMWRASARTTIAILNKGNWERLPLPLPPLAEQYRIVAKVDELMALCDRLEAARTERETTRDRMAAASLIRLNDPDPDPVVFRNHAAFALENLAPLTTRTDQIKALRQTILSLAVRGKLVEQNPNDESASELLKRIAAEKARLVKAKKISKQVAFQPPDLSEASFDLPGSWDWCPSTYPSYIVSDRGEKIQTKDVAETGKFPVVDQGKVLIRGYHNDANKVIRIKEPIVFFGDHTREMKLIDFDFIVGGDGVKLLHPVSLHTAYYFLALQWLPLESRGYGRHFKLLKASFIPLPPLAEQHRIVDKVDELMALCDQLEASLITGDGFRRRLLDALLYEALPARRLRDYLTKRKNRTPRTIRMAVRG